MRRLISALAAVLLLGLTLGIWWAARSSKNPPRVGADADHEPASKLSTVVPEQTPMVAVEAPPPPPKPVEPDPDATPPVSAPEARLTPIEKRVAKPAVESEKHQEEVASTETETIDEPSAKPSGEVEEKESEKGAEIVGRSHPFQRWLRRVFGNTESATTDRTAPPQTEDTPALLERADRSVRESEPSASAPADHTLKTVYTKEGSAIQVREYWVENGQVYMILPNGTKVYLAVEDVDLGRTGGS
jgi:hypothetical protein